MRTVCILHGANSSLKGTFMTDNKKPIGVFDSGLGGLSAVRVLKKILPDEDIIYFGDTGRVPYGTRSDEIITKYALDDMNFLCSFGVKAVLVACGTVSSVALGKLRESFDVPVMVVVDAAAKQACRLSQSKKVALLATNATVKNGAYERYMSKNFEGYSFMGIGCPMFVPLVENGYIARDCKVTRIFCDEYISALKEFSPDCIILGCTHYPIIKSIISDSAKELIGDVSIVDSGEQAAYEIKDFLARNGLLNDKRRKGSIKYFVSDETACFEQSASIFLGERISDVTKIDIGDYYFNGKKRGTAQ